MVFLFLGSLSFSRHRLTTPAGCGTLTSAWQSASLLFFIGSHLVTWDLLVKVLLIFFFFVWRVITPNGCLFWVNIPALPGTIALAKVYSWGSGEMGQLGGLPFFFGAVFLLKICKESCDVWLFAF